MLNAIKKARLLAGISQGDLAHQLGITQGSVSMWEQGKTKPSIARLKKLAWILNTSVDELLDDEKGD